MRAFENREPREDLFEEHRFGFRFAPPDMDNANGLGSSASGEPLAWLTVPCRINSTADKISGIRKYTGLFRCISDTSPFNRIFLRTRI